MTVEILDKDRKLWRALRLLGYNLAPKDVETFLNLYERLKKIDDPTFNQVAEVASGVEQLYQP